MKKNLFSTTLTMLCTVAMLLAATLKMQAQTPAEWKAMKGNVTMYMTNDMGRNGYYDQKPIAELMGHMGETLGPKCVLAVGDIHHFNGVASVNDPLWTTNYEQVYSHPELMLNWFPVLGNHEYRGNTQAVLNYGTVSRRWVMPRATTPRLSQAKAPACVWCSLTPHPSSTATAPTASPTPTPTSRTCKPSSTGLTTHSKQPARTG